MEKMLISDLRPYEKNARKHSPEQVAKLRNSIRDFGFLNPVIVDENNMILVGHGRVEAAKLEGMQEVPVRKITGLTEQQKKAYILADNMLSDLSGWDYEKLNTEVERLDVDMTAYGFEAFGRMDVYGGDEADLLGSGNYDTDSSKEIDVDSFDDDKFDYICPCCGFKFNR